MHDRFTVSVTCLGCMLHTMMCAVCTSLGCILLGENASISFMTNRMFSSIIHLLIHGHGQSYPKEWFQCVWVFDLLRVSTSVPVARGNEQKTQEARVIVFRRAANAEALATRRGIHGRVKARYTLAHRHYQHVRRHQWWPPRLCCWCGTLVGADGKLGLKNGSPEAVVYWSCLGRQSDRDARRREPLRQQYHFRCNLPPCRGSNKHLLLLYLIFFMKSFFASFFPVYVSFCYCNMFCFFVRKYVKCVGFKSYKRDLGDKNNKTQNFLIKFFEDNHTCENHVKRTIDRGRCGTPKSPIASPGALGWSRMPKSKTKLTWTTGTEPRCRLRPQLTTSQS
jgi:hypothetical protein